MRRPRRHKNSFTVRDESHPAPRNIAFETTLCEAVGRRVLVEMQYKDDATFRLFAPYAVYSSTQDKVNVTGTQIDNPSDPFDRYVPRNFEVGLIRGLRLTDKHFEIDSRFDRFDRKFQNGVICSV